MTPDTKGHRFEEWYERESRGLFDSCHPRNVARAAWSSRDEEIAAKDRDLAEAQLAHQGSEAVLHMAVARLGGEVEGHPTARHNFLQRVDELRDVERKYDSLTDELVDLKTQRNALLETVGMAARQIAAKDAEIERLTKEAEARPVWRCYHCAAAFKSTDLRAAREHFGLTDQAVPQCITELRSSLSEAQKRIEALTDALVRARRSGCQDHCNYGGSSEHTELCKRITALLSTEGEKKP
jgi:hypothetical protein